MFDSIADFATVALFIIVPLILIIERIASYS